jgi:hypothetical protein
MADSSRSSLREPRKCIFEFTCACGVSTQLQTELKDHYFRCEEMKKYYSELFNVIVRYNHKGLNVEQKKSLSAIIEMFGSEIQNNIVNEMKKQGQQPPVIPVQQPYVAPMQPFG